MELNNIKKGLFGLKKSSVLEYITQLNRLCAQQVEQEKQEKVNALQQLSQKNEALNLQLTRLESENDTLQKQLQEKERQLLALTEQNQQQKSMEAEVTDILTEARQFAAALREKAVKENEAFRLESRKAQEAERKRLLAYRSDVSKIKAIIGSVLEKTQRSCTAIETDISNLESKTHE